MYSNFDHLSLPSLLWQRSSLFAGLLWITSSLGCLPPPFWSYQSMVSSPWLQWPCETLWRVRSLFCWTFSSPCPFFPEKMPVILINFKAHDDVLPSPPRLRREFILWDLASLLSHWSLYLLWSWTNAYDRRVSLVSYSSFTAPYVLYTLPIHPTFLLNA